MTRKLAILIGPAVALLVAAYGCSRRDDARGNVYAAPEVPPPAAATTPNAYGGGPVADAAPPPSLAIDAYAPLEEPSAVDRKDAQVGGSAGGTFGASSDDRSPGAAYGQQANAGTQAPNTVNGGK